MSTEEKRIHPASFRDPSGFIFIEGGVLYRQINRAYQGEFERFVSSGLYDALAKDHLIITHEEADRSLARSEAAYKIIRPEAVPFISYPYEWCFSELKDAARLTLKIQKIALKHEMVLKDASAYNIQFLNGRPVLIDTLSFERYREGEPWIAYRQFCQNFLAPLLLMSYTDARLNQLFRVYIDGVPLDLASELLPFRTRLKLSVATHIHMHSRSQKHYADRPVRKEQVKVSRFAFTGLMDHLSGAVEKTRWIPGKTEWGDYYGATNYTEGAIAAKQQAVTTFLERTGPETVWDLGANTGLFSRIAAEHGAQTVAFDLDPVAVETNYLDCVRRSETKLLPLLLDLTNPSPAIGFENKERLSLIQRGPADLVMALAVVHHLAISNNVPLGRVAEFFANIGKALIVEFVPKSDSQVQRLLASREDIFTDYTQEGFERSFQQHFAIRESIAIRDSQRILYLMTHD
jgi:ribosomal protein L11 methylase PrmA